MQGIDNEVVGTGGSASDNWLVEIEGRIEKIEKKDKDDEEQEKYRVVLDGKYVTTESDFVPLKSSESAPLKE